MKRVKHFSIVLLTAFSAFLLLLSLASLLILNSGLLDLWAKNRVIALFNSEFHGRLRMDELHLKFPNNVVLVNPQIYGPGEKLPALRAGTVSMRFNFLTVLQPEIKRFYLRRLDSDAFNMTVIREKNGKLNIEEIFRSRDPDSTKFPLEHFFCRKLKLTGGTVTLRDNRLRPGGDDLASRKIDMELSSFTARKHLLKGTLEKLSFSLPQRNFAIRQASGKFLFSENRSEVLALKALSGKSRTELSATIDHFNIYSPNPLKQRLYRSSSFLNLQELSLHSDDIKVFYPHFSMPAGIYTLKGNAKGKADNLEILDALLTHLKSKVAVKGKVMNLQNPKALAYQLLCDSSAISAPDLESLLKEETQKAVARRTGDIRFTGNAKGGRDALQTNLVMLTSVGNASLDAELSREVPGQLTAKGTFDLKGFQVLRLMGDDTGKSLVNASGSFQAEMRGKEAGKLRLDAKTTDSFWRNQPVKIGTIALSYDTRLLNASLSFSDNLSNFSLDGDIDWKESVPRYRASGKMVKIDLSRTFGSGRFKTDLTGTWTFQGSGFDPGQLNISGSMLFSPSSINDYLLRDHARITAGITQSAQSSRIGITSDFLDFQAEGDYTLRELLDLGSFTAGGIVREISAQDIWPVSLHAPSGSGQQLKRPFTATYHITVKDLSPLALFFPVEGVTLLGKADGHATYRNGQCSAASSFAITKLQTDKTFRVENFSGDAAIECSSSGVLKAALNGKASSALFSGKKAGPSALSLIYSPSRMDASADLSFPNPAQNLALKCSATKIGNSYDLTFNTFSLKDAGGSWQVPGGSHISLNRQSARFNRFTFAKGMQQVVFDGELSSQVPGTFQCTLSGIELNELKRFYLDPSLDRLSGTINGSFTVSGTPGAKSSALKVTGQKMRYDKILIGNLQ
ncbi:MAG: translocation/assembly module TamB, partial [Chlorobiaceae bacterium]|nr:translocation/assembly module TamB [Chlorobiaceae bacterium]